MSNENIWRKIKEYNWCVYPKNQQKWKTIEKNQNNDDWEWKKIDETYHTKFLYYVILVNEILSICECHALHIL